jgi:hypothetical protein
MLWVQVVRKVRDFGTIKNSMVDCTMVCGCDVVTFMLTKHYGMSELLLLLNGWHLLHHCLVANEL